MNKFRASRPYFKSLRPFILRKVLVTYPLHEDAWQYNWPARTIELALHDYLVSWRPYLYKLRDHPVEQHFRWLRCSNINQLLGEKKR